MNISQQHILIFRALGHPIRMKIVEILVDGPICVCDLGKLTGKRQPCISQHLAILRQAGLVTRSRQGWNIFYKLNESSLLELDSIFQQLLGRYTVPE
jgi:DNA-binding transcriptional ArsR family regulator